MKTNIGKIPHTYLWSSRVQEIIAGEIYLRNWVYFRKHHCCHWYLQYDNLRLRCHKTCFYFDVFPLAEYFWPGVDGMQCFLTTAIPFILYTKMLSTVSEFVVALFCQYLNHENVRALQYITMSVAQLWCFLFHFYGLHRSQNKLPYMWSDYSIKSTKLEYLIMFQATLTER